MSRRVAEEDREADRWPVVRGQWPVFDVPTDAWGGSIPRAGLKPPLPWSIIALMCGYFKRGGDFEGPGWNGGEKWRTNRNGWNVSGNGWDTDGNGWRRKVTEFSGYGCLNGPGVGERVEAPVYVGAHGGHWPSNMANARQDRM